MSDSIREQIIENLMTRLADIRVNKGFQTEIGARILRSEKGIDPDELPCAVIWALEEEAIREYDVDQNIMPVKIDGLLKFGKGDNPGEFSEKILADFKEAICGRKWTLLFNSGGTYEPSPGDLITGATSEATAVIESITESTGAWADGDQTGSFILRRKIGTFSAENLNINGNDNAASTNATISSTTAEYNATGDLAEDIRYRKGGTSDYPEPADVVIGCSALFEIKYSTISGDPYNQP